MCMNEIKPMSIIDIGALREGDIVALRLGRGVIVKATVIVDVKLTMLRSQYVPHKRDIAKGHRSTRGRFIGHNFVVPVEYVHPGKGVCAVNVTPLRRDMLVNVK